MCVVSNKIALGLLYFPIGPENWRHSLNQSDGNNNQSQLGRPRFPAVSQVCLFLLWALIGFSGCFRSFWLTVIITLVLVLQHSVEKLSMQRTQYLGHLHQSWVHILQWDLTRCNVVAIEMGREMASNLSARFTYKIIESMLIKILKGLLFMCIKWLQSSTQW